MNVTAPHTSPLDRLHEDFGWTPRQRQVLDLLAQRRTNGEIATALGISLDGAKWHVSEVMTKLGTSSRDEAAEYWRAYNRMPLRFSRAMRALVAALSLRMALVAVGALVVVGVVVLAIFLVADLGADDGSQPAGSGTPSPTIATATAAGTASVTPTAASSATPASTETASATPVPLEMQTIPNGGTLPSDNGLLYVDLDTGEMEFWPMPGQFYYVQSISRDGRWVVWTAGEGVHDSGVRLLDTESGEDRLIEAKGSPVLDASVSPDGRFLLARSDSSLFLLEPTALMPVADAPLPDGPQNGWDEFSVDGSVASAFGLSPDPETVVVLRADGTSFSLMEVTWPMHWSSDGRYLAVATDTSTQILDRDGHPIWEIPFLPGD